LTFLCHFYKINWTLQFSLLYQVYNYLSLLSLMCVLRVLWLSPLTIFKVNNISIFQLFSWLCKHYNFHELKLKFCSLTQTLMKLNAKEVGCCKCKNICCRIVGKALKMINVKWLNCAGGMKDGPLGQRVSYPPPSPPPPHTEIYSKPDSVWTFLCINSIQFF
jgi:hypothetical protein